MTLRSTNESTSIFEDGKLKPGIYKIQNLFSETYLDIHQHSNQACCRPAKDLEDGKGLVRLHLPSVAHESDCHKWEIKALGDGYAVRRVSSLIESVRRAIRHSSLNNARPRSNQANLNSSALQ